MNRMISMRMKIERSTGLYGTKTQGTRDFLTSSMRPRSSSESWSVPALMRMQPQMCHFHKDIGIIRIIRRHGEERPVRAQAAPPAPLAAATAPVTAHFCGESILKVLSGASLGEALRSMPIKDAAMDTVAMLILIAWGGYVSSRAVRVLENVMIEGEKKAGNPIDGALRVLLVSVRKPLELLVPFYGLSYGMTLVSAFLETVLEKFMFQSHVAEMCSRTASGVFSWLSFKLSNASKVTLIVFVGWFLLNLKNEFVQVILKGTDSLNKVEVERFVKPFSQLLSWGIVLAAGLTSLATIGVDVTPMLTLGSVSTVAVGFAAQSTIANLVSALALYTSRTFIAGDRVQFKSMSGSTVVSGTVQDIRPMRTLVKCDNGSLVYVNNKDLATSLMVVNESELSKARLSSSIPVLETVLTIQYKYVDCTRDVVKHIDEYMKSHPKLDPSLKRTCYLQGFSAEGPQLYIKGTLARAYAAQDAQVFTEIMLAVERIVRENGAFLYVKRDQELPPALT